MKKYLKKAHSLISIISMHTSMKVLLVAHVSFILAHMMSSPLTLNSGNKTNRENKKNS